MRTVVASQVKRQSANHRYDLSQFGVSADEVLSAFAPYCERFGLSRLTGERQEPATRRLPHMIEPQHLGHDV
jgi:hypothetical protein